jgi:hypothetical protein
MNHTPAAAAVPGYLESRPGALRDRLFRPAADGQVLVCTFDVPGVYPR